MPSRAEAADVRINPEGNRAGVAGNSNRFLDGRLDGLGHGLRCFDHGKKDLRFESMGKWSFRHGLCGLLDALTQGAPECF